MNIFTAIDDCDYLVTGVDQPELQTAYRQWCDAKGITFVLAQPGPDTRSPIQSRKIQQR